MAKRNVIVTVVFMLLIVATTGFAATSINGNLSIRKIMPDIHQRRCRQGVYRG